jgi:hypothetical protein
MDPHHDLMLARTAMFRRRHLLGIARGAVPILSGFRHAHPDATIRHEEKVFCAALDMLWEAQLAAAAAPAGDA